VPIAIAGLVLDVGKAALLAAIADRRKPPRVLAEHNADPRPVTWTTMPARIT
jgi:hypothetical protein